MNFSATPDLAASATNHASIAHALDTLAGDDNQIGVAVSGGSDSLALLLHAASWARTRKQVLRAATVDHGLRPEAASEAAHVAAICASLNIPHETLTWRPPTTSIAQSAARTARYQLLTDWAARRQLPAIAIGHTQNDRLETFLIRARAGSTWYGLAGPMPAAPTPIATHPGLRLIRPLLATTRTELRDDLRSAGVNWINDPTNNSRRHERVRMRALLASTTEATQTSIIKTMNRLAEMRAATLAAARDAFDASVTLSPDGGLIQPDALTQLPEQARLRLLEALIFALVPRNAPPRADRLAHLTKTLADPAAAPHRATLAGCWFRADKTGVHVSIAPPRRNATQLPATPHNPAQRARLLLMKPHARLLRIVT